MVCAHAAAASKDHPRSRGVYAARFFQPRTDGGSSPLARGLPDSPPETIYDDRIIPARAGFTLARLTGRTRAKDHPRSRGVYPRSGRNPT